MGRDLYPTIYFLGAPVEGGTIPEQASAVMPGAFGKTHVFRFSRMDRRQGL